MKDGQLKRTTAFCRVFEVSNKTLWNGLHKLRGGTWLFYFEQQIKQDLNGINICGCRCNERLKAKTDVSSCFTYTGLCGELEHQKIETRLIDESFECVMVECVI